MRFLFGALLLSIFATWAGAQITGPITLDPWIWYSLKADNVFDAKVAAMGGVLGAPKAAKKREASLGYSRQYDGGTLYTAGGADVAYAVNGDILGRYLTVGGPTGVLGLPTSDWTYVSDNRGWYNTFTNGAIYWTVTTGAWEIHSPIYSWWLSLGGRASWLGYPVTGVQAGSSDTGIEKISAFENGMITYNTNGNGALAAFGYRDLIIAKYNAIGGPKSKIGLPMVRSMPVFLDGLGSARMAFRGGSVWVPLNTARAYAQYQTQIQVRLLGVESLAPSGASSRVAGAVSVFVPSTRAFGTIMKLSDWGFQSPNNRVGRSVYPNFGAGNTNNLLYDGPPTDIIFSAQILEARTSSAAGAANWLATAMGLDIIGRVAEADGAGNPPITIDKAYEGEARSWPFRIGQTAQTQYGASDTVYPWGTLRLLTDTVNQHSQQRGQCINDLSSTNCPWGLRSSTLMTVQASGGGTGPYKFHFVVERWQVWLYL
ncbi:hypothetical protein B0T14DRAFT_497452 [Immersiella caudata]|uniref:Uncharacterized protein n=1 Tax=Immersiella caudata TaxID=314043 RepID=A0AA39WTI6_9PEZI|nr:hypothetical protein B0T14DRAFT_497452 [Immersiella caudata]